MTYRSAHSDELLMDGYKAHVTLKAMKRMRVRINPPEGTVAVSAPLGTPDHVIERFLEENHGWILQTQAKVRLRSPGPGTLVTGGRVRLWGNWLEVVVLEAPRASAHVVGGRVVIHRRAGDDEAASRAVEALYRREMNTSLEGLLRTWEPRVGRSAAKIRLRRMTSRWGSCNTVTCHITFNTALARFPPEALEFVVVHELTHLLERGHGPVFKSHLDRLLPDWSARRELLREGP
ncbi:MAG: SprT family zinc-dependent metalloprotease [Propionibacteriaceae bacterium]|nr:SprT family zinc-dependent metalloprotease [Propionibacteriaceae bacterium]